MKLLLCDVDDTIIDTAGFKLALFDRVSRMTGRSDSEIRESYTALHVENDGWVLRFCAELQTPEISGEVLYSEILKLIPEIKKHQNVIDFVSSFNGTKMLYTLGDSEFQKKKIDALQLLSFVDSALFMNGDKFEDFALHMQNGVFEVNGTSYDDVTVIDNRTDFLSRITAAYPSIHTIDPLTL